MLENDYLQNKFKTDVLKFSRNYEGSIYNNDLNSGLTFDSNIIFTPESYLPRSAMVNLTIDLFGESLNLFEIGGRFEGFEQIIDNLFGLNGYFKDDSPLIFFKNLMQYKSDNKTDRNEFNNNNTNEIIEYSKDFNKNYKLNKKPQASIYSKIFGNELYLKQFEGLNELFDKNYNVGNTDDKNNLKSVFDLMKYLINNNTIDYTKSTKLLNTDYIIPTITGLPLEITINGSAIIGLKYKNENNFDNFFKSFSASILLSINPSAIVEISGTMSVNALFTKSGLKSVTRFHTNTKNELKFNMENSKIIELSIGLPDNKMEIIDISSELFVFHKNIPVLIDGINNIEQFDTCSGDRIPTKTGLQLCTKFVFNNVSTTINAPYFPLNGPFRYALLLDKTDTFSNYYFKFQLMESAEGDDSETSGLVIFY